MSTTPTEYDPSLIPEHIASLGEEARQDWAYSLPDEPMTDALIAACGASNTDDLRDAKRAASAAAQEQIAALTA